MTRTELIDRIVQYLDGTLSEEEQRALAEHLRSDADARRIFVETSRLHANLPSVLGDQQRLVVSRSWFKRVVYASAAAAAALVAILVLPTLVVRSTPTNLWISSTSAGVTYERGNQRISVINGYEPQLGDRVVLTTKDQVVWSRGESAVLTMSGSGVVSCDVPQTRWIIRAGAEALTVSHHQEDTAVRFAPLAQGTVAVTDVGKVWSVTNGQAYAKVAPQAVEQPLRVLMPGFIATVVGTAFTMSAEPTAARLSVTSGSVRCDAGTTSVLVKAGDYAEHQAATGLSVGGLAAFIPDTTGLVVMDARHGAGALGKDGSRWTLLYPTPSVFVPHAMIAQPNRGKTAKDDQGARLDFTVRFAQAGNYFVWIRGYGQTTNDNTINLGLNGLLDTNARDVRVPRTLGWSNSFRLTNGRVQIAIPAPGQYTINVWMREDGVVFDRMILAQDRSFTPTDVGPSESRRE